MPKYLKLNSSYIKKKFHQYVSDGTIYYRDWVTIGGVEKNTPGQTVVYSNGNFVFTTNSTPTPHRKSETGSWETPPSVEGCETTGDYWTECSTSSSETSSSVSEENEVVLNRTSNDIRDFAYYGSAVELLKASIRNIVKTFPAELFLSGQNTVVLRGDRFVPVGWNDNMSGSAYIVQNPFQLDLTTVNAITGEFSADESLHYLTNSFADYVVIQGNRETPVTSYTVDSVDGLDFNCLTEGQLMATITINNIVIKQRYVGGRFVLFHNTTVGTRIRPNETRINSFFNGLEGFEKLLLNRQSKPIYTNSLVTPFETNVGLVLAERKYTWPVENGWNLDVTSPSYSDFISGLYNMAQLFDDYFTDNLYRSMTHEAIKNFDWTFTREYGEGEEEKYVLAGTKVVQLIRCFGRYFDDIKRYVDGIKFTNRYTYNKKNNQSESLFSEKLALNGWVVTNVTPSGRENDETPVLYTGESVGYKFSDVNTEFMRRLILCSKPIFKHKGTREGIRMLLALFGMGEDQYTLHEYKYTTTPITDTDVINRLKEYNYGKEIDLQYEDDPYSGLLVKEVVWEGNTYLIPWYEKDVTYDGDVYYQMYGGWEKKDVDNNADFIYGETCSYINVVNTLDDLLALPLKNLSPNDVYYVYDITGVDEYAFNLDVAGRSQSNYFVLGESINASRYASGWTCVTYQEGENGTKVISADNSEYAKRVVYLESIKNETEGNNPHVGFGKYDGGREFFEYEKVLLKYAIDHVRIQETGNAASIGFQIDTDKPVEDNEKVVNVNVGEYACIGRNPDEDMPKETVDNPYLNINLNTKLFVFELTDNGNPDFRAYFRDYILPYLRQVIPSTVLFGVKGVNENEGDSLILSKGVIRMNESMNSIDSGTTTVTASGEWTSSPASTLADGIPAAGVAGATEIEVKKKSSYGSEQIKFTLDGNPDVGSYLNVIVSQISAEDLDFTQEGGEGTITVTCDGTTSNSNFTYQSNSDWLTITRNGNEITVKCNSNTSNTERVANIVFTHNEDPNCWWVSTITQEASEYSITASKIYDEENGVKTFYDSIGESGGVFYVDISSVGGSEDFSISEITSSNGSNNITVERLNNVLAKVSVPANETQEDVTYNVVFAHKDDPEITANVTFTIGFLALSITVNGSDTAEGTVSYEGGTVSPVFIINAVGGSSQWEFVNENSFPSWLSVGERDGSRLVLYVERSQNTNERSTTIEVCHADDDTIRATITISQTGVGAMGISVTPKSVTAPFDGGTSFVTVLVYGGTKNLSYSETCDWVTVSSVNMTGDYGGYKEYRVGITSDENKGTTERNCSIVFSHASSPGTSETVEITQSGSQDYAIYATLPNRTDIVTKSETFPYTAGSSTTDSQSFQVHVTPSNAGYVVQTTGGWVRYAQNGDLLTIWCTANTGASERSSTITLINGMKSTVTHRITVVQEGAGSYNLAGRLSSTDEYVNSLDLILPQDGSDVPVDVLVSGGTAEYEVKSKPDWVNVNPSEGTSGTVNISANANTGASNRSGKVVLSHKDNSDYILTINVSQEMSYSLTITPNDGGDNVNHSTITGMTEDGGTVSYSIVASGGSGQWKYVGADISWITINGRPLTSFTGGTTSTSIKVSVAVNDELKNREATLTFQHADDADLEVTISVLQEFTYYMIAVDDESQTAWTGIDGNGGENTFTISVTGGTQEYEIQSFLKGTYNEVSETFTSEGEMSESELWITTAITDYEVTVTVSMNEVEEPRAMAIVFAHADDSTVTCMLVIAQKKGYPLTYEDPILTVVPSEITYDGTGGTQTLSVTSTADTYRGPLFIETVNMPYKFTMEDTEVEPTYIFLVSGDTKVPDRTVYFPASGGTYNIPVRSVLVDIYNGGETPVAYASRMDGSWAHIANETGERITITSDENEGQDDRTTTLYVTQEVTGAEYSVSVSQGHWERVLSVEDDTPEYEISSLGGYVYPLVLSYSYDSLIEGLREIFTPEFEVSDSWINEVLLNPSPTTQEWCAKIGAEENTGDTRTGTVTLTCPDDTAITTTLTIVQRKAIEDEAGDNYFLGINGNLTLYTVSFEHNLETTQVVPVTSTNNGVDVEYSVELYSYTQEFAEFNGVDENNNALFTIHPVTDYSGETSVCMLYNITQSGSGKQMLLYVCSTNAAPGYAFFVDNRTTLYIDTSVQTIYEYTFVSESRNADGTRLSDIAYSIVNTIPCLKVEEFNLGGSKMMRLTVDMDTFKESYGVIARQDITNNEIVVTIV